MPVATLYPRYDHPAIEERYASWQSQLLLRRGSGPVHFYDFDEKASHAAEDVETEYVLVITDPMLLAPPGLGERLAALLKDSGAFAAVPLAKEAGAAPQQFSPRSYMTLRELEIEMEALRQTNAPAERVTWTTGDPGAYVVAKAALDTIKSPLADVINGRDVIVSHTDFIHRWASMRGQLREDILSRVSTTAKSILEIGCGEGVLGGAIKQRQKCRVVGIEIDRHAVAVAKKRIDDVFCGEVTEVVALIHEEFDCVIGGDIVEHLAEPWTFIADLRRIVKPGGQLLLSIPNLANASIVADLLQGRFDYVYMGLACAGHLRFFTRRTIEDMLAIAGWDVVAIEPQELTATPERDALIARLEAGNVPFSRDDLLPTGFYVTARKPEPAKR